MIDRAEAARAPGLGPIVDIAANHPPIVRAPASHDGDLAERQISEHTHALSSFNPASVVERLP